MVAAGHVVPLVAHNEINGGKVAAFVGHGAERMTEGVKPQSFPIKHQLYQQLLKLLTDGIVWGGTLLFVLDVVLYPTRPKSRQERQPVVCRVCRVGAGLNGLTNRCDGSTSP